MTPDVEVIDEQSVGDPRVGQPFSTVALGRCRRPGAPPSA